MVRVDGDRVVDLQCTPPLAAKVIARPCGPELVVIGSAASLLEGDEISINVAVGSGGRLTVTTVAAQVAHPCPGGGRTVQRVRAHVGEEAVLRWRPEPTVVCAGGRHLMHTDVVLGDGADVMWREELVLGRTGEDPGRCEVRTELVVDDATGPLLRDGLDTTRPRAFGPAVLGHGSRYVGSHHRWSVRHHEGTTSDGVTRFDLAGSGTMWRTVTSDVSVGRASLEALWPE